MKWMIILVIGIRQMSEQRYADDKPRDCRYCYFWNESSEVCERQTCYYLLPEEEKVTYTEGDCRGCPYGIASRCIGYCTAKIIKEFREGRGVDAGGSR